VYLSHHLFIKIIDNHETFQKCSILFKVKEEKDFNRRNTRLVFRGFTRQSAMAGKNLILTQPARHREPLRRGGREIGQKGAFFKGLN
jgi:hypothetical protein